MKKYLPTYILLFLFFTLSEIQAQVYQLTEKKDTAFVNTLLDEALQNKYTDLDQMYSNTVIALKLSKKLHYSQGLGKAYKCLGVYYYFKGDNAKALLNYEKAIDIFKSNGVDKELGMVYNNTGLIYKDLFESAKALKYFQDALELARKTGNERSIAITLVNIGSLYYDEQKYDDAIALWEKALILLLKMHKYEDIASVYTNLGVSYERKGNFKKAINYHLKALEVINDHNISNVNISTYFNNLATAYLNSGDYNDALFYINKAIDDQIEKSDSFRLANRLNNRAEIYRKLHEKNNAYIDARTAQKIAKEQHDLDEMKISNLILSSLFEDDDIYDSALYYYKLAKSLQDSIIAVQDENRIANLNILNHLKVLKAEEDAQKEYDIIQQQKTTVMWTLGSMGIISILFLVLQYFYVLNLGRVTLQFFLYLTVKLSAAFSVMLLFLKYPPFLQWNLFLQVGIVFGILILSFILYTKLLNFFSKNSGSENSKQSVGS